MDNGTVDVDYRALKRMAFFLGHIIYDPYKINEYIKEANWRLEQMKLPKKIENKK